MFDVVIEDERSRIDAAARIERRCLFEQFTCVDSPVETLPGNRG